jgi:hypothetical protein
MFNWFKKCINEAQELDNAMNNIYRGKTENVCRHESDTNDCNLVQQLKEKQSALRTIENDIKAYSKYDLSIVQQTKSFLKSLESCGLKMDKYYRQSLYWFDKEKDDCGAVSSMFEHYGAQIIEKALYDFSLEDINNIFNELKSLKQKTMILEEKEAAASALRQDIANIKMKLGIE